MVDKSKSYDLSELERLLYSTANTFHGGGDLSNLEILNVAIPTIFLKRVLDLREDYIETELKENQHYKLSGNLVNTLKHTYKDINEAFNVSGNNEWFFVTYQDIINYQDNEKEEEVEISLSIDPSIKLKTTAANRIKFVEEIYNRVEHKVIKQIFNKSRYFTLYLNDKLSYNESNILFNKFANHHFGNNIKTDMFSSAYIYLISTFASSAGKKGGEFFTPDPICKAVVACLEIELRKTGKTKVCDITSGSATFLIELGRYIAEKHGREKAQEYLDFYLQEKESQSLILGEAGLLLAGFEHITAYHGDTLLDYIQNIGQHRGQMDYFVGNPPYGAQILQDYTYKEIKAQEGEEKIRWTTWGYPPRAELEWFFVQSCLDMVHEKGKGALVLPLGTLFKNNTRKAMVEKDYVEGIITLPNNMFQTTGIPVCIWIFNKDKKKEDKEKVFMLNNSLDFKKEGKYNTVDFEKLISIYTAREEIEGFSKYIELKDMKSNDFNLSMQRYVFREEEKEDVDIAALNTKSVELSQSIQKQENSLNSIFDAIANIKDGEK